MSYLVAPSPLFYGQTRRGGSIGGSHEVSRSRRGRAGLYVVGRRSRARGGGTSAFAGSAGQETYRPGEPITLRWRLTNNGTTPCRATTEAAGSVMVTAVTRDGTAVPRSLTKPRYDGDPGARVLAGLTPLAPGAGVDLAMAVTAEATADANTHHRSTVSTANTARAGA